MTADAAVTGGGPKPYVVPGSADVDKSPERRAWLAELERLTKAHRERRAVPYQAKANLAFWEAGELLSLAMEAWFDGDPHYEWLGDLSARASSRGRWHDARALARRAGAGTTRGRRASWSASTGSRGAARRGP